MRVAVIGSRSFSNYPLLAQYLDDIMAKEPVEYLVSGGAKGADTLAEQWAKDRNIKTVIFYPNWETHGKVAGILRNQDIVANADLIVAFWDGISRGTQYTIEHAKKSGLEVRIIYFGENND